MFRLNAVIRSLRRRPRYTLMRGVARFSTVRDIVAESRKRWSQKRLKGFLADCESRMSSSVFPQLDRESFVRRLREDGVAFGLKLPSEMIGEIRNWSLQNPCFADRDAGSGFLLADRSQAEVKLGKPILLAQYFNAAERCDAIGRLVRDPMLQWIACRYLESLPTFVGANLWWTFPVVALESDRERHAHLFHRDIDDFRFFKFFFYLTDVDSGEGAHVCVKASHRQPPRLQPADHWLIRRYSDQEITSTYPEERILEICGPAGTGFAENTLCVHKGLTPRTNERLLLQLQFALFDYGAMHDRVDPMTLRMLV